ncbi:Fibrinogen, alpha/beta/gamma chain, C-terminal globular domain [Pseudocohnilembus persalinus]|uniref:Fibrinogen, alpha/beta/gamma chain, C-terminal globular domain n=1 Tax=Pseudocohnilembus persalinus TaxID=266149 RepID=A0A0V0QV94_PSEPJ|nr:Fibrinogen, alpha/beta/gamma chain, C-terminal globular domain [Pseudocohnilembus persalinus]|eukprot:KRX06148.1 Fibrinogen, alpha/beta/gamma chain, C-terminal globular domain [Pseudocohnilembus persalinus]
MLCLIYVQDPTRALKSLKLVKDVNDLYYFSDGQTFEWCEQYQQNVQFLLPDGWYKEKYGIDASLGMYCIFDNSHYNILSEYQIILNRQSNALDFSQTETVLQNFYGNKNQFYMGNDYIFSKCNQSQQCELIIMMETTQTQQKLDIQIEDFFFQQNNSRYQFKGQQICSNTITDYSCVSDWNDNYFYAQSSSASAYDTCQIPGFYNSTMCSKANLFGKYNYLAVNQQQSMAFFNVLGDNSYTDISKLIIGIRKYNTREACTSNQVSNCKLSQNSSACLICETGYYREYNGQCISCASAYSLFCTQCNQNQCIQCMGGRIAPNCYCSKGNVPDINNQCNRCQNGQFFNSAIFDAIVSDGSINIQDYESQVCQTCKNYNQYCTYCNEQQCLKCQGSRIAPGCFCHSQYVPDINNNCNECPQDTYFDQTLFLNIIQDGTININDYQSQVCLSCQSYNAFCTQCDSTTCLTCDGDRIAPDCFCSLNYVPEISNNINCIECQDGSFYNQNLFQQKVQDGSLNIQDYQSQVCQLCTTTYNNYCTQCDEETCLQCQGERTAPDCFCQFSLVPNINNNCNECPQDTYFNHTLFQDLIQVGTININDYESQVCISCQNYNQFCNKCDTNTCLSCDGDRIAPDCYCSLNYVPDINNNCVECQDGYFFNSTQFQNIIINDSISIDDYKSQVCISCQNFNNFCTICDLDSCISCEGDRMPPNCLCPLNQVPDENNNCVECQENSFFNSTLFQEKILDNSINLDDYQSQVCQKCTLYNDFCTLCDKDGCLQCAGDRVAPDCYCSINLIPGQNNECIECNGQYFNTTKYNQHLQSGQLNIYDYESQVCVSCQIYNQFCDQCDNNQCFLCQGDRIAPDCYCQQGYVPDINNNCNQCQNGHFFNFTAFDEVSNLADYENEVCQTCSNYNQFCSKCDQNTCLSCQGERITPNCLCSIYFVPDENNNCIECQNGYFFNSTLFQEKFLDNSININDYESQICITCKNYNDFCTQCDDDTCLACEGDRVTPDCYCPLNFVPEESNNCVECQEFNFFNQTKFQEIILNNSINLQDYESQVCQLCTTTYNNYCTYCDEETCLQCQGERIAPGCYCQFSLVPDINNNCNECQPDHFFNHAEFQNLITNNLINLAKYESQVCQSCKIHNLYCIECDANTCLNCQGERLAPDCFCMSDFVPDLNSNCNKCQQNQYFSEAIFQSIKLDNTININDYENQVCQPCQLLNQFCTQCDDNQCLQCEGDRIAPSCFCQIGLVPNQADNTICEQCPDYHQFNYTEFEQIQISYTLSQFQSYISDVCINCQIEYNQFCTKCDEERCLQCEGDRLAPDCLCQTGQVPSIFNNIICQNCQNTYFFNFTKYNEKLIDQLLDLQNYEAQVCFKCSDIYNQFCLQCDEQTCLECDGDRVSPECYCQNTLVPNQQDPLICEQCPADQFFDSSIFQQIFADQTNLLSYKSLVCNSDCSLHNQYCTLCDEEFCNECAGNRVLPDCFCSPGQVADQTDFNNCKFCNQNQYYSDDQFQLYNCVQNYTCSEIELCINCDQAYNQQCSKCNENICNECIGNNRQIPDCLCLPNYVPDESDPKNCVMCSPNTYYNKTAISGCSLDDQLDQVIGCQKSDFCVQVNSLRFCDSINIYYNTALDEFQCYKCQGNRVLPYCQCQNQLMPVLGNEQFCQQCDQNQYYAKSLDDCKNKTDIQYVYNCLAEDACVECKKAHNKYCSQCNTDFCLVCEGNRVPPYCKCPYQMVSIQNQEICQYCYYDTYYNEPADLCTKQLDDQIYDCFFTELCVNCSIYNKFCILCDSNECLECHGNRVPPFCKCPEQWVTPNQNENQVSISCVQCSNLEYYNEIKDECRANLQIDENNQSQIQKYMDNLECYQDNVCDKCTDIHQFCSTCEKNQKQMSLNCQFCQGDLVTTYIGLVNINGENLNVTTCRCPQSYYSFNNNTSECIICMQNAICEGSDRIIVKSGFWRISNSSSDIFECKNNPDSCLGGADNFTCAQGYVGALCESCDYLGDFWGDEYGKQSDFICEKCQKHWMYLKVGIYIFTISSLTIFISFQGIKEVQNGIIQDALQKMFQESREINLTSDYSIRQIYPEIEQELDQYLKKQQQINKNQFVEFQKTVRKLFENKNEKNLNKSINTETNLKSLQQNSSQIVNSDISLIKNQQHTSLQDCNIVFNSSVKNSFYQHKKNQNMTDESFLEQSPKFNQRNKNRKRKNNEYQNQIRIIKQSVVQDAEINKNMLQQINYNQFQQDNDQIQVNQPNNSIIMEDSLISYREEEQLQKEQCKQSQKDDQQKEIKEEQIKYQTQQNQKTNSQLQNFIQKDYTNTDKNKKIGIFQQDYQQQKSNIQQISKQMNDQQDIIT